MVLEGVTVIDPAVAPPVEKPVPVQEVAFVELHVSVEDWPAVREVGLAEREAVGGLETTTVAPAVAVPPLPVQLTE